MGRMSGDLGPAKLDTSPYSSLGYDGYMGFVPGMQEPYEAFDPSLGYSSYSSGMEVELLLEYGSARRWLC